MRIKSIQKLLFVFLLIGCTTSGYSQRVNFDQVIQPFDQIAEDFEEFPGAVSLVK